jgi:type II secretory pathway pseudopilin PulG
MKKRSGFSLAEGLFTALLAALVLSLLMSLFSHAQRRGERVDLQATALAVALAASAQMSEDFDQVAMTSATVASQEGPAVKFERFRAGAGGAIIRETVKYEFMPKTRQLLRNGAVLAAAGLRDVQFRLGPDDVGGYTLDVEIQMAPGQTYSAAEVRQGGMRMRFAFHSAHVATRLAYSEWVPSAADPAAGGL